MLFRASFVDNFRGRGGFSRACTPGRGTGVPRGDTYYIGGAPASSHIPIAFIVCVTGTSSGRIVSVNASFLSGIPFPVWFAIGCVVVLLLNHYVKQAAARAKGAVPAPRDVRKAGKEKDWNKLNEHHTPKVIGSIASLSTSVDAQLLAPAMPHALCNGEYLNSFGASNAKSLSVMLRNDWDITDRASLLRQIYDLLRLGHRAKFEKIRQASLKIPAANTPVNPGFSPDRWRQMRRFIMNDRGSQTIDFTAWDLLRAASLTRAGEALGWITRDEAVDTLALINHGLRTTYSSWKEIWEAFAVGRWLWLNEEGKEMASSDLHDQNRKEILTSSTGIWTRIPWDGTYPSPRYLLLDASPESFQLNPMSRFEWENAPVWERELDNESQKRMPHHDN